MVANKFRLEIANDFIFTPFQGEGYPRRPNTSHLPMKPTRSMIAVLLFAGFGTSSALAEVRTWTDVQGRQVSASLVRIEGEHIVLQTQDGAEHRFELSRLSAEDQAFAKSSAPAAADTAQPQMIANATVAQAAQKINELVAKGLVRANPDRVKNGKPPITQFNPMANDEQFVRRVYLDIVGRIPNYDEAMAFIKDGNPKKRADLIDMLLDSEGFKVHMFNYFAEMLRLKDNLDQANLRGTPYINWVKEQVAKNRPYDQMVHEMMTELIISRLREGKIDAGILVTPLQEAGIKEYVLFYEELMAYVSRKNEVYEKTYVLPQDIDPNKLWLLEEGHCFRSQIVNLCELQKISREASHFDYEAGSIETLRRMVEMNDGITIIPELATLDMPQKQTQLIRHFKKPSPMREVSLVVHRNFVKKKLIDVLRQEILHTVPEKIRKNKTPNVVPVEL